MRARRNIPVILELGSGETALGPAIRPVVVAEESVFLFKTKPRRLVLVELHHLGTLVTVVELIRSAIGVPAFREDEDVRCTGERIREDGDRLQIDVGALGGGLGGRGPIKVPCRERIGGVLLRFESLQASGVLVDGSMSLGRAAS